MTRRLTNVVLFALLALGLSASPSSAAVIIVNTTADENGTGGGCSLREAIRSANENTAVGSCAAGAAGLDTISVPPGTFVLSIPGTDEDATATGDLDIVEDVAIVGAGAPATILDGALLDRLFDVLPSAGTATITDMTITRGDAGAEGSGGSGGAIRVEDAALVLGRVHITGNVSGEYGGAIYADGGVLTLTDTALTGNTAPSDSEAIDNIDGTSPSPSVLTNVTISGNHSDSYGGGIGVDDDNPMTLNNVTVTGNTVAGATNVGGGIGASPDPGSVTLRNSIVAGNTASGSPDCFRVVTSEGYNLIGNADGCTVTPAAGDAFGTGAAPVDPLLGPLADNGGPTPTRALLKGSQAIDAGSPAPPGSGGGACAATDQRGLPRNCDIGAYELVYCQKVAVNRIGTAGKDSLVGTSGPDGLLGLGGKDTLKGKAGNDGLCGGSGKDTLKGGGGKDRLDGGPGKDLCVGQAGRDKAKGCEVKKTI